MPIFEHQFVCLLHSSGFYPAPLKGPTVGYFMPVCTFAFVLTLCVWVYPNHHETLSQFPSFPLVAMSFPFHHDCC